MNLIAKYSNRAEAEKQNSTRIFCNYYRVAYFGKKFGAEDGKSYIYKMVPVIRLADFTSEIVQKSTEIAGEEVLKLANKHKSQLEIDPDKHYVQIVSMTPVATEMRYFRTEERYTEIEQNFNLSNTIVLITNFRYI